MAATRLLLLLLVVPSALGFKHFQQEIPNGDRVPDPAMANVLWQGVGHMNANGGKDRNVFGLDFNANNHKWDKTLCQKDSDSDGKTNGEELGDPDCVWTSGSQPSKNVGLSHPGICEPIDTEKCKEVNKDVLFRSAEAFDCPAIHNDDVNATEFRFTPTTVPAEETSYFCQFFPLDIPEGTSEHVVAYEPIIDNDEVMHHTIVYGCRVDQAAAMANQSSGGEARSCNEGMSLCQEMMLLWTVGINGQCHPGEFGGLIGEGGYTAIWMEHHWNNPLKKANMTDSSGIRLYHTPQKRESDAAYILVGPYSLNLPAGEENILQQGGCTSECTKTFGRESILISEILPHMHYYGRAMTVSLNGKLILEQRDYHYDDPTAVNFNPPLEVKRGDSLSVNCTFTTTSATERTYFGLATSDEMCFAIALVHPFDQSIPNVCQATEGYGVCKENLVGEWGECNMAMFWQDMDWISLMTTLYSACDHTGMQCHEGCAEVVHNLTAEEPCLDGKMKSFILGSLAYSGDGKSIVNMLTSCDPVIYDPYYDVIHDHDKDHDCEGATCGSASLYVSFLLITVALLASHLQL